MTESAVLDSAGRHRSPAKAGVGRPPPQMPARDEEQKRCADFAALPQRAKSDNPIQAESGREWGQWRYSLADGTRLYFTTKVK
jgi:hypothetical protein